MVATSQLFDDRESVGRVRGIALDEPSPKLVRHRCQESNPVVTM